MKRTMGVAAFLVAGLFLPFSAAAQTRFDHKPIAYVVPEKRVRLDANVTDPKGVKLARVYFKTPAQADYVFVPMTAAGNNRFVATLPATNASAASLQYVLLAVNNLGDVARSVEYTVAARKSAETPAWQNASSSGDVKVYSEAATAPQTVAGFSDSISMDVVESSARFGASAGLYSSSASASTGASGAAASSSTAGAAGAAGTAAAVTGTAAVGGLSTAAIIGGVVVAGAAAAAASGGGGGGGGSTAPTGVAAFAGTWGGTYASNESVTCNGSLVGTCTASASWSGTADAQGNFTGSVSPAAYTCTGGITPATGTHPGDPLTFTISATGAANATLPNHPGTINGAPVVCAAEPLQFTTSPARRVTGAWSCTGTGVNGTLTCADTTQHTFSGS